MIPLFKPAIAPEAVLAVSDVLASGYIGQGTVVDKFEHALEPWIGPCVTTSSGTAALHLAYDLAGLRAGDIVLSTPMTCLATNMPLAQMGVQIAWLDVDPQTGLVDVTDAQMMFKEFPRAKALIVVSYGGQVPDLPALYSLCARYGAKLILDAAHSFGAYHQTATHFTCYSFQAIKHLTTGDGGALVTQSIHKLEEAKLKRWFGLDRSIGGFRCEQVVTRVGYKYHMNDIAAAIGLANLAAVESNIRRAKEHAARYDQAGLGKSYRDHDACWLYTILVHDRAEFVRKMEQRGIQAARVHSRNDIHPIFATPHHRELPGVTTFDAHQVSIPVGWWLSDNDVGHVIQAVKESL